MASDTDLLASLAEERRGAFRPWGLYLLRFLALAAGAVLTELVGYTYLGPWIRGQVAQVRPLSEASWRMLWLLVVDTPGLFGLVLYFTHVDRLRLTSLAFQREAFRALFDHTVDAAAILDLGGRVVAVNRAAEEILGRPRAELLGARGWSWFPEAQIPEATRRFREAFLHPVAPLELAARHPEGREVSLLTRFVPIYHSGRAIGAFCIASDVSALKAAVEQAERLARRDPLTGLANRRELEERLAEAIREARARRGLLAVMYVDLDNFKLVNDALGHEAGDAVLAAVARRLEGCVRGDETVARFGGDEFVVVLPRLSAVENAEAVALRIVRRLGEPVAWDGYQFSLTASVGIALYPAAGETAEALLKNADAALYEAKRQGKNRYHVHMPYLTQRAWDRLRLESELRRVLRDPEREFYVEYQPQVDLESGRVVSAEALVRWRHPELGNIPPAEFIPVAEEVGLIHKIGSFVLQEVCRQIARWREEGRLPLPVAVNVSPAEMQRADFVERFLSTLARWDVPPAWLAVEITETALIRNQEETAEKLRTLHQAGVRILVDDFGEGYNSLAVLRELTVDGVKVDQMFVREIDVRADDAAVLLAIGRLAHAMELEMVAEGVERQTQLAVLQESECDLYQGFLFSLPLGAAEFAERYLARADEP